MPETSDLIASLAPDTLLCATGGIADGRGLAAALTLGADGIVVRTRFVASDEASRRIAPTSEEASYAISARTVSRSHVCTASPP